MKRWECQIAFRMALGNWMPLRWEWHRGPGGMTAILRLWTIWLVLNVTIR